MPRDAVSRTANVEPENIKEQQTNGQQTLEVFNLKYKTSREIEAIFICFALGLIKEAYHVLAFRSSRGFLPRYDRPLQVRVSFNYKT